jgi:fatty acid desaturase
MAHATTSSGFDFTPEEGLHQIQQERTRKSVIAAVIGALATIAVLGAVYLSYRGVPAPATPANAHPVLMEPYH